MQATEGLIYEIIFRWLKLFQLSPYELLTWNIITILLLEEVLTIVVFARAGALWTGLASLSPQLSK